MNENFKLLNEFKGFGEPSGKIWFIGIEEGGAWSEDPNKFKKEIEGYTNSCGFKYNEGNVSIRTPVYVTISKIMSGLNGNGMDWNVFRKQCLFRKGTDVFQMNLFPLGKKKVGDWPDHYKALFGYGIEDYGKYLFDVRRIRFPILENFWRENSPEITVCFGKMYWSDFKELLKLGDQPETYDNGCIQFYRGKRVVLTPFFGRGHMGKVRIQTLVRILKNKLA